MDAPHPRPDRLETCARRVRTLSCDLLPITGNVVAVTTFQTIAQFRPSWKVLFTKLREVTYNAGALEAADALPPLSIFSGPSIARFALFSSVASAVRVLLEDLPQRASHIRYLDVDGSLATAPCSSALASSLSKLKKLSSLKASVDLTQALWKAVAQHPSLVTAGFPLWMFVPDPAGYQPRTFANLQTLVIASRCDRLCRFFESQNALPTLTYVGFAGISVEQGRSDLRRLCELLAQKVPRLASVRLGLNSTSWGGNTALGLEDFRPLLQCKRLQSFQLEHPCGVSVTTSEVSELLDAWPGISTLALHHSASINDIMGAYSHPNWTPPTLPLNILDTVAAKVPRIKELRLVLDVAAPINSTSGICQQQF